MVNELRSLSIQELKDKKNELEKKRYELRFDSVMGHLANVSEVKFIKRNIARINTLLRENELGLNQIEKQG